MAAWSSAQVPDGLVFAPSLEIVRMVFHLADALGLTWRGVLAVLVEARSMGFDRAEPVLLVVVFGLFLLLTMH